MLASDTDLSKKLLIADIKANELEAVLADHYRCASQRDSDEVIYSESDSTDYAILLKYEKDKVTSVKSGPALSSSKFESIIEKIKTDIIADTGSKVASEILFNYYPTDGYFRLNDIFQLRPVPIDAPRPNARYAKHPGILEIKYKYSPNMTIGHLRFGQKSDELGLLLHALLEGAVEIQSHRIFHQWVQLPKDHWNQFPKEIAQNKRYAYLQVGYSCGDRPVDQDDFTKNKDWKQIESAEPFEYYNQFAIEGRSLQIPSDLGISIKKYYSLGEEKQQVFLRACYWSHLSCQLSEYSFSAAYNAKVIAIETLIPKQIKSSKCPTCKRELKDGPTKAFINFVESFVPESEVSRTVRKKIYRTRSKLSHGRRILPIDFFLQHVGLPPDISKAQNEFWEVGQIMKIILYKWLHAQ